jgi:sirohydrochlorin cobaltochelatase
MASRTTESPAIILFAHGARDPEWAEPFRKIQRTLHAKRPGLTVELAFLDVMEPSLPDAISALVNEGHRSITIAPIFMAQGGHLKNDLPKILNAIRAEHKETHIRLLPPIGEVEPVLNAISDWLLGVSAS